MDGWYPNDFETSVAWTVKALPLRLELRLSDLRKRASVQSEAEFSPVRFSGKNQGVDGEVVDLI